MNSVPDEPEVAPGEQGDEDKQGESGALKTRFASWVEASKEEFWLQKPYWMWIGGAGALVVAILVVALVLMGGQSAEGTLIVLDGEATLTATRNRLLSQPETVETTLTAGDTAPVSTGDMVLMGEQSSGQILLKEHIVIELFEGTELEVRELSSRRATSRYELNLLSGRVHNLVSLEPEFVGEYKLATPSSAATVRGTIFTAEVLGPEASYYATDEGVVTVQLGDEEVEVAAGEEVTAIVGQPLEVKPQSSDVFTDDFGHAMVLVPAGEFEMGGDDALADSDEQPLHDVTLDAYYIDQTEVTFSQHAACVGDGACEKPTTARADEAAYANHPAIFVSWEAAYAFCEWRDARLPTEAEWEKAARWDPETGQTTLYPWGDDDPTQQLVSAFDVGDTTEVGSYPDGASAVGALDMAGNVWEWVQDWYSATYYGDAPGDNPQGPESDPQGRRVMRGGDFADPPDQFRSPNREAGTRETAGPDIGFRCVRDVSD